MTHVYLFGNNKGHDSNITLNWNLAFEMYLMRVLPLQHVKKYQNVWGLQLTLIVSNSVDSNFRLSRIFIEVPNIVVY